MRFPASLISSCTRALYESLSIDIMSKVARMLDDSFDLYRVANMRESIPITSQHAADVIVKELLRQGMFVDLIETLITVDTRGIMGRRYTIGSLGELAKGLSAIGFLYDKVNNLFMEDPRLKASYNFGRLQEGGEYPLALLRLDIVQNSKIVRKYPKEHVEKAYQLLYEMVEHKVHKRWGRIWSWEGDGGVAAFYYGHKQTQAALTAMDLIQGVFLFNTFKNPLEMPIQVRIAVHYGVQKFSQDQSVWKKSDTARIAVEMESKACNPDEAVISTNIETALERNLAQLFEPKKNVSSYQVHCYRIRMEE